MKTRANQIVKNQATPVSEKTRLDCECQNAWQQFKVRGAMACMMLVLLSMAPVALAGKTDNPGIIPVNARYGGHTYGEWMAKLTQWSLSIPAAINPEILGNEQFISTAQPDHLWFLANTLPVVERHFEVPVGVAIFALIFGPEADNFLCVDPPTDYTVPELRALAKSAADSLTDIHVDVDGIPVRNVAQYRATTPVFYATLPSDNLLEWFGCSNGPGTYGPMVGDMYALILAPMSVGEHTIHETAVFVIDPSDRSQDIQVDVLWHITVVPGHK